METGANKAKLAVWKFSSCDGCQLTLLDCEDDLLEIASRIDIAYFLEASSDTKKGPYDISLIEGSITTPLDVNRLVEIRKKSKFIVTIGACATAGGIQALRNTQHVTEFARYVYPNPEFIDTLETSKPIAEFIEVDFELRGCPINKGQLIEVITSFLHGRQPSINRHSVCNECKAKNNVCVMVANGTPCMGPVTQAGCGAICPSYQRGCYGCYGPKENAQPSSLTHWFKENLKTADRTIFQLLQNFNADAEAFANESKHYAPKK